MNHSRARSASLAALSLLATTFSGCASDVGEEPVEAADEGALSTSKTLHAGPVEILGASKARVLFRVDTDSATELRMASRSIKERVIATFPKGESVFASRANSSDRFLVRHYAALGSGTSWSVVDLASSSPTLDEVVPATVATSEVPVVGANGVVVYGTNKLNGAYDVTVKAPGAAAVVVGKGWGAPQISDDGELVAYRTSTGNVGVFASKTAKSTEIASTWDGAYALVGNTVYVGVPHDAAIISVGTNLTTKTVYETGAYTTELAFTPRPDGKLLVTQPSLALLDPATGSSTYLTSDDPAIPRPHAAKWRSVVSNDGLYLLSSIQPSDKATSTAVWLYAIDASGAHGTKLIDGVAVGYVNGFGYGLNAYSSLGARCDFVGHFISCTKAAKPFGQSYSTSEQYYFSAENPSARLPYTLLASVDEAGSRACWARHDVMNSDGTFGCIDADQNRVENPSYRPRGVAGDSFYKGLYVFEETDKATSHHLLELFDPSTGAKTNLFDSTCKEGSYRTATTTTRLFVSDCNGLYSR